MGKKKLPETKIIQKMIEIISRITNKSTPSYTEYFELGSYNWAQHNS